MTIPTPRYPFSDLDPDQIRRLVQAARMERNRAIRSFFSRIFGGQRARETQVWPPKNMPALSLTSYR